MRNNLAESVRFSADIVRVVSDYVTLKGSGSNLKGLCPFHAEKTPSFSVHGEKQIFHCFGCGVGGDVFKFVMLIENAGFPEAIQIVAEKCGIPLPRTAPPDDPKAREREALLGVYERACRFFQDRLASPEAAGARRILEERAILPEFIQRFGLGYAPSGGLLRELRVSDPAGTGLFVKNQSGEVYDRFRRRLIFPIWNDRGRVIAFGGRIIGEGDPKYLNSPESPLYSKSFVLYGLHLAKTAARKAGRIIVVEGYFDCLSLHQNGVENVVASCGTSLTAQQASLLARSAPEVVVNYDPDAAGQSAAKRSIELLLERGLTVRILRLPGGLDPDDFVRRQGPGAYRGLVDAAPYFWEHLIAEARAGGELHRPEVKSRAVGEILGYVGHVSDPVVQLEIVRAVGQAFQLPEPMLIEQLRTGRKPTPAATGGARRRRRLLPAERQIIQALDREPSIAAALGQFLQIETDFLQDAWSAPVLRAMIQTPERNVEQVLAEVDDAELSREVREAVLEPVGRITLEMAVVAMGCLYQEHLTREEKALREELKRYGSNQPAPADLIRRQMEIASRKSKLKAIRM